MGRKAQTLETLLDNTLPLEDCFIWQKCIDKDGYGVTSVKGKKLPAHRAAISFLKDVSGKYVLHTCSNRACINPEHLYLGDQKQNIQDQIDTGTFVYGSKNGMAKLTEEDVKYIRESPLSTKELADSFQVSYYTMWDVKKKRTWKKIL